MADQRHLLPTQRIEKRCGTNGFVNPAEHRAMRSSDVVEPVEGAVVDVGVRPGSRRRSTRGEQIEVVSGAATRFWIHSAHSRSRGSRCHRFVAIGAQQRGHPAAPGRGTASRDG